MQESYALGDVKGLNNVGGLIGIDSVGGSNKSNTLNRWILKSYSKGNIEGNRNVGGVIGNSRTAGINAYIKIRSSHHTEGSVTGTRDYIGGLVGYGSSVTSSYHVGGDVSGASYVGGLMGLAVGDVKKLLFRGKYHWFFLCRWSCWQG